MALESLKKHKANAEKSKSSISQGRVVEILKEQAGLVLRNDEELQKIILEGVASNVEEISEVIGTRELLRDSISVMIGHKNEFIEDTKGKFSLLQRGIEQRLLEIERKATKIIEITKVGSPPIKITNHHKKLPMLIKLASLRLDTLLSGPAGSGKGTASRQVAEALGLAHYYKSCSPMDTTSQWFGYMDANGHYIPSLFRKCYEEGGVFLIDELDASNAQVSVTLNAALADGYGAFPDKIVKRHEDCVIIAAANTWGYGADRIYVGRNQLDAATLDRFTFLPFDYDEALEMAIASNSSWALHVQKIRSKMFGRISQGQVMRYVVSPRASIKGSILLANGVSWDEVESMVLFRGWSIQDIASVRS